MEVGFWHGHRQRHLRHWNGFSRPRSNNSNDFYRITLIITQAGWHLRCDRYHLHHHQDQRRLFLVGGCGRRCGRSRMWTHGHCRHKVIIISIIVNTIIFLIVIVIIIIFVMVLVGGVGWCIGRIRMCGYIPGQSLSSSPLSLSWSLLPSSWSLASSLWWWRWSSLSP